MIVSLARLPLPLLDIGFTGLVSDPVARAYRTLVDPATKGWHWRWVTLSPGAFCPIVSPSGSGSSEDAPDDSREVEVEIEGEYLPTGLARRIADPFSTPAFDATPASFDQSARLASLERLPRSLAATFSPSLPRAAWLQCWTC